MALTAVIAGIKAAIAGNVPVKDPGDQQGPYPVLIVYPYPGDSTPMQHRGAVGEPVYQNRDQIVVEWHTMVPDLLRQMEETTPVMDSLRAALWADAYRTKFDDSIVMLHAIHTDHFGQMTLGSDLTFGVRLFLEVTHATEV